MSIVAATKLIARCGVKAVMVVEYEAESLVKSAWREVKELRNEVEADFRELRREIEHDLHEHDPDSTGHEQSDEAAASSGAEGAKRSGTKATVPARKRSKSKDAAGPNASAASE